MAYRHRALALLSGSCLLAACGRSDPPPLAPPANTAAASNPTNATAEAEENREALGQLGAAVTGAQNPTPATSNSTPP